jgi:hypothetical protein
MSGRADLRCSQTTANDAATFRNPSLGESDLLRASKALPI